MSTPWKSPLFPAAPNPTPTVLPPPRALRPPIYNPYDKFTQPEFDAWIGDITGALRRALGREEEEEEKEETLPKQSIGDALLRARDGDASITAERGEELDEAEEDPSILEDSFAHVKSRRAKGKARDPREGPGLGKRDQPIEILSDSDEGSVDDAVSWHGSVDEDGEGQYYDDEASEEEDDDEEEEEEDWSRAGASRTVHVLSSDEEDEVGVTVDVQNAGDDDDGDGEHVRGIAGASKHAGESLDSEDVDLDVDVGAGDEEFPPLSKSPLSRTPEVADPWDGPRTYAEDFYSGGDRISPGPEVTPSHLTPNPASPIPIPGISADDDDFTITPGVLSPETSPPREVINVDEDVGPSAIQGSSPPADTEKDGLEDIYADLLVYPDAAMQPGPVQEEDREFAPSPATPHISRHTKGPATPEKSPIPAPHTPVSGDWDWLVRHVSHPGPTSPHVAETSAHVAGGSEDEADDDDEDEDHEIWGAMPLGTSDLDVQDGWGADEHAEVDDDDEEDEIQEFEPTGQEATVIDDVTIAVNAVDGVEAASPLLLPSEGAPVPIFSLDESTIQLADEDSFGDLPPSGPQSEAGSPRDNERTGPYEHQRREIERLFAELDKQNREAAVVPESVDFATELATLQEPIEARVKGKYSAWVSAELEGVADVNEFIIPTDIPSDTFTTQSFDAVFTDVTTVLDASLVSERPTDQPYTVEEADWTNIEYLNDEFGDVASVGPSEAAGLTAATLEYIVEEPRTEGRLTEELATPEEVAAPEENSALVEEVLGDDRNEALLPSSTYDGSHKPEALPDEGEPLLTSTDAVTSQPTDVDVSTVVEHPATPPIVSANLPIPAPVTADPTVPDPASPHHASRHISPAPMDTPRPSMLSAVPASVLKAFERDLPRSGRASGTSISSSGLFTPVGETDDATPTPSDASESAEAPTVVLDEADEKPPSPMSPSAVEESSAPLQEDVAAIPEEHERPPTDEVQDVVASSDSVIAEIVTTARAAASPSDAPPALSQPIEASSAAQEPPADTPNISAKGAVQSSPSPHPEATAGPSGSTDDELDHLTHPEELPPALNGTAHHPEEVEAEADADGEVDPDYAPHHSVDHTDEVDPFQLMGSGSKVAPGPVEDDEPSSSESTPAVLAPTIQEREAPAVEVNSSEPTEPVGPAGEVPTLQDDTLAEAIGDGPLTPPSPEVHAETQSTQGEKLSETDSDTRDQPPRLKRKRLAPDLTIVPRVTRSKSTNTVISPTVQRQSAAQRKGKGKAIDKAISDDQTLDDNASDIFSTSSGPSAVRRMLAPPSRAQSVVSTGSAESSSNLASPSSHRRVEMMLPPLLHGQSFIHHHHGRVALPPAAPLPSTQPKTPIMSRSASVEAEPEQSTQRPTPLKRLPSMNSPVTRSNCRFHKISLPREEGGPRVSFVVPGCSLGDGELMGDQEIEDHGFATKEDYDRMIPDIEALDLNVYLIGVLRQLVGVDLLREQEIFYLPNPGEEVVKKRSQRKSTVDKLRLSQRQSMTSADLRSLAGASSPQASQGSRRSATPSLLSREHTSAGDTASVGGSSVKLRNRGSRRYTASIASGSVDGPSDGEDDLPKAKRRKVSPPVDDDGSVTAGASTSASAPGPEKSAPSGQPTKPRRSNRRPLHLDAAAYKPDEGDTDEDEAHELRNGKDRRAKGGRRGAKRGRTMEEIPADVPKPKKTRLRKSVSTPGEGANGTE